MKKFFSIKNDISNLFLLMILIYNPIMKKKCYVN